MSRMIPLSHGGVLALLVAGAAPPALAAQVGDISNVNYPGWLPSDRVRPAHAVTTAYDATATRWTYDYTLINEAGAEQDVLEVRMRFNAPVLSTATAPNWEALVFSPSARFPGAVLQGLLPEDIGSSPNGPAMDQIQPGGSRTGFRIVSPYPPGYARSYTQGFAPIPYLPADWESTDEMGGGVPADTTNSQRRFALGPIRYTQVQTGGNRRPGADGFLGFMNLSVSNSVLISPAPIALKFSLNGETVFRETLRVELNGVDVTAAFKPGPADGADLVGVFQIGSSPLQSGKNILLTSVEGNLLGSTHRATDADRITFYIDQARAQGGRGTNALNNSPDPEPCTDC